MGKKRIVTIDLGNPLDSDWIKTMPGHKGEVELHDELARKYGYEPPKRKKIDYETGKPED